MTLYNKRKRINNIDFHVEPYDRNKRICHGLGYINMLNETLSQTRPENITKYGTCNLCLEDTYVWSLCLCKSYAICHSCFEKGVTYAYTRYKTTHTCIFNQRNCAFRHNKETDDRLRGCTIYVSLQDQTTIQCIPTNKTDEDFNEKIYAVISAPITYRSDWIIFYVKKICTLVNRLFLFLNMINFIYVLINWTINEEHTLTSFYYTFIRFEVIWVYKFPLITCKFMLLYLYLFKNR